MQWLKADFHMHTNDCIFDGIPHSACQLIDHAARLGFSVLSFTNHYYMIFSECWKEYAWERGILLLPGVEARIKGKDVLIINAARDADRLRTFEDLKAYRRMNDSLIVAPHPFYPGTICLRKKLYRHFELFDALEYNSFYTPFFNPNKKAEQFAREHNMTLLGGSDAHRLSMLERTYSLIKAELDTTSVFRAIREGDVEIVTRPMPSFEAVRLAAVLRLSTTRMDLKRLIHPHRIYCEYQPYPVGDPKSQITGRAPLQPADRT